MMKKGRATRFIVNGVLLAAIVALGITVFQAGTHSKDADPIEPQIVENDLAMVDELPEEAPMIDAGTSHVETQVGEDYSLSQAEDIDDRVLEPISQEQSEEAEETAGSNVLDEQADSGTSISLNFTEESLMEWPVEGSVIIDYSMDSTVYYPTLDVYKVNPAIVVSAEVGTPVKAAVAGTVTSITENEETGTTVTMDLGNGYEAVYGQLQDLAVWEGETVDIGAVLGTVSNPTKYYLEEGSNVYFAMRKDGTPVDPITYLP